jgi:CheY-like chemotaxis protein
MMTMPGMPRPGRDLGIWGAITKPVKTGALFELLDDMLEGRTTNPDHRAEPSTTMGADRPLTILLAEDNPVNQRVATLMLQRLGYQADVASNGREAIEAALRQHYDLVLMDVQMPEVDGMQAARDICEKIEPSRRPRIVAMTANASVSDRNRCLAAGMSDFLTKPVRAEDLRRALEETPLRKPVSVS